MQYPQKKNPKGNCIKYLKKALMQRVWTIKDFFFQKLNYIHLNPVRGNYKLVSDWREYEHSSAGFYELQQIKHFTPVSLYGIGIVNAGSRGFAHTALDEDPATTEMEQIHSLDYFKDRLIKGFIN